MGRWWPATSNHLNIRINASTHFQKIWSWTSSSSHRRCSIKKDVLENFAKFTRKRLCQSLFFNKKKRLWHRCFPVNLAKFLRTPFLQNTSVRLLLNKVWTFQNFQKKHNSWRFLHLKKTLVVTFSETRAPTSSNYVAKLWASQNYSRNKNFSGCTLPFLL